MQWRRLRCLWVFVGTNLFVLAGAARAGMGCWDLFSVGLHDDFYWNKVNGCSGPNWDELFIPPGPPDGTPIITTSTKLGGVMYAFGGHDWNWGEEGTADLESDAGTYSISGGDPYVSVVLDTKTLCDADELFPSWGDILEIGIYRYEGMGNWVLQRPDVDFTWVRSPCDIASTLGVSGTFTTNIRLAPNDFGDDNTWWSHGWPANETQPRAVYGFGARLQPGSLYRVDFTTDVRTWDSYNRCMFPPRPEPASWMLIGLGGLLHALFRRRVA